MRMYQMFHSLFWRALARDALCVKIPRSGHRAIAARVWNRQIFVKRNHLSPHKPNQL
jgi:hypothetical protein